MRQVKYVVPSEVLRACASLGLVINDVDGFEISVGVEVVLFLRDESEQRVPWADLPPLPETTRLAGVSPAHQV